jgi:dolichyl-phosphate beta-glucosyltransferase
MHADVRGRGGSPVISVVIPCLDEEARIAQTIRSVIHYFGSRPWTWEIIVVDDGSRDETSAVARTAAGDDERVRVRTEAENHGKGWAFRAGFEDATGEHVLLCDADLSTPIDELDRFMEQMDRGLDLVIASRVLEGSEILIPQPLRRRVAGALFRRSVSLMRVTRCVDTQCGFKLMRRDRVAGPISEIRTDGFAFDVELLMRCEALGLRVGEEPVRWSNAAGSKFHMLRDGPRTFADLLRIRSRRKRLARERLGGGPEPSSG